MHSSATTTTECQGSETRRRIVRFLVPALLVSFILNVVLISATIVIASRQPPMRWPAQDFSPEAVEKRARRTADARQEALPALSADQRARARHVGRRLVELMQRGPTDPPERLAPLEAQRHILPLVIRLGNVHDLAYVESGQRLLTQAQIARICELYGVSEAWFAEKETQWK